MQLYNRKVNKVRLPRLQKTQVILYFAGRSGVGVQLMIPHACQLPHPRSGHCVHKPRLVCCITSLPPKTHMTPVASRSQQHGQSHQLPHSAATCASHVWHRVPRMAKVQSGSSRPLFANLPAAGLVPFPLQACHDNLQLSCCLEPFELPPLFEQSLAQNSVIRSPQLDNMPHSRHACNHATSSVVAVNIVCPLST